MRSAMVNFRADPTLLAALREQAGRSGETMSEIIRSALRERVTVQ